MAAISQWLSVPKPGVRCGFFVPKARDVFSAAPRNAGENETTPMAMFMTRTCAGGIPACSGSKHPRFLDVAKTSQLKIEPDATADAFENAVNMRLPWPLASLLRQWSERSRAFCRADSSIDSPLRNPRSVNDYTRKSAPSFFPNILLATAMVNPRNTMAHTPKAAARYFPSPISINSS